MGNSINNKKKRDSEQKVVMLEEWYNFNTFEKDFMTNLKLERLARELVEWARNNSEAIKIKEFIVEKGISEKIWHEWYEKYPVLKAAHNQAKTIIGNRREKGVMTRKYESSSTNFMMPHYDKDWDDQLERRAKLNRKEEPEGGTKIIIMEKTPNCDEVPKKKENK